ncbi:DUF397 domain-containing protein [Spirillospora sp. NPDC050679]
MRDDHASASPWTRSSRCGANGTCVEVARSGHREIGVRDSGADAVSAAPVLTFDLADWRVFAGRVKAGAYDL